MPVNVTAAADIVNETNGTIQVPEGSPGVVDAVKSPPDNTFQVTFTITDAGGSSQVQKWVEQDLIHFEDGAIGPARAVYEGSSVTISAIRYPGTGADFDGALGEPPIQDLGTVELVFSDGSVMRFVSERAKGAVTVELE